jgi:hypothetical protein
VRVRRLVCAFLALVLFLPTALAAATGAHKDECGMQACKRSKTCCCKNKSAAEPGKPTWQSSKRCPPNCGQPLAFGTHAAAILTAEPAQLSSTPDHKFIQGAYCDPCVAVALEFVLYSRPPPHC